MTGFASGTDALSSRFVHLHVHTEYSLLDGSIQIAKLVSALSASGFQSCAITDHESMHGAIEFYLACTKAGLNGILGCEVNLVNHSKELPAPAHHLILLAENNAGYQNLVKICSFANVEGVNLAGPTSYAVTLECLRHHSEGIICLTSCLKGETAALLIRNRYKDAIDFLEELKGIFGPEHLFIEIADNGLPEQKALRPKLVSLSKETRLQVVASADVHYLKPNDKKTHLSLLAIKHKLKKQDVQILAHEDYDFHLATEAEMIERFQDLPEALENTVRIAKRCKLSLNTNVFYMPDYRERPDESANDCLVRLSRAGLEMRQPAIAHVQGKNFNEMLWQEYKNRLEYELGVIKTMNFAGYFLIVQDFINWAKKQNIPVGPGRGSAAGSLVTYALSITNIDPIRFNLLFERFLNPERVSMPDIDTDFCQDRRQEVLDYCYKRYGEKNVCQIVTFGRMMARNAIKNLARISGWSFMDSNDFAKLIPESPGITLKDALEQEEKLRERLARDERARELWDDALTIEGTLSSLGIHAAGVIISDRPLTELSPVMESEGQVLTQYEHKYAEKIGLIKFDFLGLKTLTVIQKALDFINETTGNKLDIETIELEDPRVYEMISTAHVTGVFQLESTGMRKLISELKPSCFSDIVAVLALFRPGPLGSGMVEDFVLRKHGKKEVEYPLPQLEPILADTYGVIVFQEQVQKIAAVLANYSLGEADLLRRAMGKKDAKEMEKQKKRFVTGCEENKIDTQVASDIFDLMEKFAQYGFNKSHTAAYGWVTYQTAFLKTYFPTCFMAAILSCDLGDTDKVVNYLRDCKRLSIHVVPPDINNSNYEFKVVSQSTILYGLGAIKGVGQGIVEEIVRERQKAGPFVSVPEFIARVDSRKLNKKTLESFIKAGAFDALERNRCLLLTNIDSWLRTISREQERMSSVGAGLFDDPTDAQKDLKSLLVGVQQKETQFWPIVEELEYEKSTLGLYLTGHPASLYDSDFRTFRNYSLGSLSKALENESLQRPSELNRKGVRVVGILSAFAEKRNKDGEKFGILKLEDSSSEVEINIFPKQYAALDFQFKIGDLLWVNCQVRKGIEQGTVRLSCNELGRLDDLIKDRKRKMKLNLKMPQSWLSQPTKLDELLHFLRQNPGPTQIELSIELPEEKIAVQAGLGKFTASSSLKLLPEIDRNWPRMIETSSVYLT